MPNKPCPWCQGTDIVPMEGYAKCGTCKAEGPYVEVVDGDYETGLELWNERVDERDLLAELKECRTRLYYAGLTTVQLDRRIEEAEKMICIRSFDCNAGDHSDACPAGNSQAPDAAPRPGHEADETGEG